MEEERLRNSKLQQSHASLKVELTTATTEVEVLRDALKDQELAAAASNAEKERIQQKLSEVEEKARRADQHRFALQWLGIFVAAVALVIFGLTFKGFSTKWIVVACVGTVIAWMWVAGNAGRKSAAVREWSPYQKFQRMRRWINGILVVPPLGDAIWDGIKYLLNP
ncbi:MAG: hypothetical protein ACK5TN_20940 [Acidobacteriota bacterium]